MGLRDLVYRVYERRLEAKLSKDSMPRHVGVIIDGNRRWARAMGMRDVATGHRKGADKIAELLTWCRETGVVQGLGLGLFICERIMETHKGRISVESAPGSGATFYLHFPLAEV